MSKANDPPQVTLSLGHGPGTLRGTRGADGGRSCPSLQSSCDEEGGGGEKGDRKTTPPREAGTRLSAVLWPRAVAVLSGLEVRVDCRRLDGGPPPQSCALASRGEQGWETPVSPGRPQAHGALSSRGFVNVNQRPPNETVGATWGQCSPTTRK